MKYFIKTLTPLLLVTLTACGGGGGGSAVPATPASVTITGTAAQGSALPGAAVTIKCAGGNGTATTGADGSYTATVAGALPCALKVVGTNGATFHSVVAGTASTGSFTANISPLTELLVANATGAEPETFFTNFTAGTAPSAAAVTQAITALKTLVAGVVDLTGIDPLTDTLMAANGGNAGNALDQKIDTLIAALATAQTTLAQVTTAVATNPNVPDPIKSVLAPVAASCSALRSGKYRAINPYETDPLFKHQVITVDAVGLSVTESDGAVHPVTANGNCQFTVDGTDETNTVMVGPAGMLVTYGQSKLTPSLRNMSIGLPEQTLPISELAGTWNVISWEPASGVPGRVAFSSVATLNATGQITAIADCVGLATCVNPTPPYASFSANATGGFDLLEGSVKIGQLYVFKTVSGAKAFVAVTNDGSLLVGSPQQAFATLPDVGLMTNFREFTLNGNGSLSTLLDQTNTVIAVDAAAKTITRLRSSDQRLDTITRDKPRDGLRYRAPNSCTFNGVAGNCSEFVQLVLQGMGITFSSSTTTTPTGAFLSVSVNKPS